MPDPSSSLGAADFLAAHQSLLPRGRAWSRDPNRTLTALLTQLGIEKATVHQALATLLDIESDPAQASAMLSDWETCFGLPDPCTGPLPTLQQRHAALIARIADQGGQSRAYFIGLAAALGFTITITEYDAFRAGTGMAGYPLLGPDWIATWTVNTTSDSNETFFEAGLSAAGEPLLTFGNAELECPLRIRAPAHTNLLFAYT